MSDNENTTEKKPWWNDGDKMGGLLATWTALLILTFLTGCVIKFFFWIF